MPASPSPTERRLRPRRETRKVVEETAAGMGRIGRLGRLLLKSVVLRVDETVQGGKCDGPSVGRRALSSSVGSDVCPVQVRSR